MGCQCLGEGQGWVQQQQLWVPDFNLPIQPGENPSYAVHPVMSQNSHGLKRKHLVLRDHLGLLSLV